MTRYQAESRKQERRKKKTLVNRLTLATSALNRIKSPQIESPQGISEGGVSGCPNHLKRKRITSPPDFLLGSVSPPNPSFKNTFGEPAPSVWLVLLSPGPGWLVLIAANLPKNTAIFASGGERRATKKTEGESLEG